VAGLSTGGEEPPVNGQPHLPDAVTRVAGLLDEEVAFSLEPVDPEGDAFAIYFKGCASNVGVIRLCKDSACAETITLDCSVLHDENTEAVELDVDPALKGFFQVGWVDPEEREAANTAYFVFDDGVSQQPALDTAVIFDVLTINTPPTLLVGLEHYDIYNCPPLAVGESFMPDITVSDDDFNYDLYLMTIKGTLDNSQAPTAAFDVAAMSASLASCQDAATITATYFEVTCTLPTVQGFLRAVNILAAQAEGFVGLHVIANDNGHTGQCPEMLAFTSTPCPREDAVQVNMTYTTPGGD
jgi:hypothetical protein